MTVANWREPYWPYVTPDAKRDLAAQYRRLIEKYGGQSGMDPEFWDALATLQEEGRLDEWRAQYQGWKDTCEASKPHPRELLNA